jgi:hypothetical protein
MNASISDARLEDLYYVFYPYSDKLPKIVSEDDLQIHVPSYYTSLLLPAKAKLSNRRSLEREGLKWWELERPRSWQQTREPKIVSKYFGGVRSFAYDKDGNYVVVVGHAWFRQQGAVELGLTSDELYFAMLAYLNSNATAVLLEYTSVQVSGGQFDLSNKYVKDLPIINLAKLSAHNIDQLVQRGSEIASGKVENWRDVDNAVISALEV